MIDDQHSDHGPVLRLGPRSSCKFASDGSWSCMKRRLVGPHRLAYVPFVMETDAGDAAMVSAGRDRARSQADVQSGWCCVAGHRVPR